MAVERRGSVAESVGKNHNGKFGFTIYRIAYDDDEAFARFLTLLTAHAHVQLDEEDCRIHRQVKEFLDWNVQDCEAELSGASISQVRDRFNEWVESVDGDRNSTRYAQCIYADAESIQSVINGEDPTSDGPDDVEGPEAFVKVIDWHFTGEVEQCGPNEVQDQEGENYPPIDGCRRKDVGWMKVAASSLIPRVYEDLSEGWWHVDYVRPPGIRYG